MQKALDHIEEHKVYIEALNTFMIPASEAYRAVELSIDSQLQETISLLQEQLGGLVDELQITEDND